MDNQQKEIWKKRAIKIGAPALAMLVIIYGRWGSLALEGPLLGLKARLKADTYNRVCAYGEYTFETSVGTITG